jgi:selenocysteine-specific elongation factor
VAEWYVVQGLVTLVHDHVAPPGEKQAMSAEDERLLGQVLGEFADAAYQPPAIAELRCRTSKNQKRIRELIDLAVTRGDLVRVMDGMWLHRERWDELVARVVAEIRGRGGVTVAQLRTMLDSSRKYVVPIAERLDAAGITRRVGDERVLGAKAPEA